MRHVWTGDVCVCVLATYVDWHCVSVSWRYVWVGNVHKLLTCVRAGDVYRLATCVGWRCVLASDVCGVEMCVGWRRV